MVYLGAPNSEPINFIRARVYSDQGTAIGTVDQNLDPGKGSFDFSLNVQLPGARANTTRMTLELANKATGGEIVQYSGRIQQLPLAPGDFRQVNIDLYPGPLDNFDVRGVHIVKPIRDIVETDTVGVKAVVDGATPNTRVIWSSLDGSIATIDAGGVVQGKLPGTARVVAAVGTFADTASVRVTAKRAKVVVTPGDIEVAKVGDIGVYTATVVDPRGAPIANERVTWSIADRAIGSYVSAGTVQGMRAGATTVTARAVSDTLLSGSATFRVKAANPGVARIDITPSSATLRAIGATQGYTATARDANGNVVPNVAFNWSSSATSVASIGSNGMATAIASGTTTIRASVDTVSATAGLAVTPGATDLQLVSGASQNGIVMQPLAQPIVVRTVDARGNPVAGVTVQFTSDTDSARISPATAVSGNDGTAQAQIALGRVARTYHFGVRADTLRGSPMDVTATAAAGDPVALTIVTQPSSPVQNRVAFSRQPAVALVDAYGNRVNRAGVTITATHVNGSANNATAMTDATGIARFTGLSIGGTVGDRIINFTASLTSLLPASARVTLTPGAPASVVPVTSATITAQAGAAVGSAPVVRVLDADGNPVAGATVTFAVAGGNGSIVNTTVTTLADGTASVGGWTLGTTAGTNTLTATVGTLTATFTATGTASAPSSGSSTMNVSTTTAAAGSNTPITVTIQLRDANGNPLTTSGGTVAVSSTLGTVSSVTDNGNGTYTATLTPPATSGTAIITATLNGTPLTSSATVAFQFGAPSAATTTVSVGSASLLTNGTTTITVTVRDANGTIITNATPSMISLAASGGTIGAITCTNGMCTAIYTAPGTAGTPSITATVGGTNVVSSPLSMTVSAPAPVPSQYVVTRSNSAPAAGANVTITAQLADAGGGALSGAGRVVTWSSTNGGSFSAPTSTTNAGGQATITFIPATVAGTVHTVMATDASSLTGTSGNITVGVGTPSATTSTLAVGSTSIGVNGTTTITVTVKDSYGNVIAGATPSLFALSTDAGTIGTVSCTNGVCTATFTAPASAGTSNITATISSTNISGSPKAITITAAAPTATQYLVTRSSASPVAGSGVTITAQLADAAGSSIGAAGHVVTWSTTNGGSFSSATSTTDVNGQATVTFTTAKVAATVHTVTATESALSGTSGNITTVAGAFAKVQLLVPGEVAAAGTATGKSGTPSAQTAASSFTVTVNAVDANWNIVSSTDAIAITSSDGAATLPANAALVSGTRTFPVALNTTGTATLTATDATDGTKTGNTSPSITVNAGGASATTSTVSVGSASVPTNGTTTVTVTIRDAGGNVLTGATSSGIVLATGSGSIGTVSCTSGVCTATYTAPASSGNTSITAKIGGTNIVNSPVAMTITPVPTQFVVTRSSATPTAGAGVTIAAQLADAGGNPVSGSGHVVTWSSTNGGSFGSATSTTNSSGIATVTFTTSTVAGTVHTVTGTESSLTGTSGNITTAAGPFARLQLLVPGETAAPGTTTGKTGTPSAQTAASSFTVTVNAVDANWNAVSATDNVAISSSDAGATLPANAALVAGTRTFPVALNAAGTATLTATDATDGTKSANTSPAITVNTGGASAATSTIAVGSASVPTNGTTTVTVTIKDAGGNILTHATSSDFTLTAGGGSLGTVSCTNGVCTATYTAPASAGSTTISAKIGGTNIVNSAVSMTITAVPTQYVVTRSSASPVAGAGVTITAQLADASGNPVSGSGRVITWSSTNGGSFSSATSTTNGSGVATVTFTTSSIAGTVHTVTATENSLTGTSGNITTTTGAFTKLQLLVPGETAAPGTATGKTGTPSAQTAASSFSVTVNAVDANWNVVSATDNIAITSSDGATTLPSNAALVAGTKTFPVALNTAGTATLTATDATDAAKTANTSPTITVNTGAASATTSTIAVGSSSIATNATTTVTVTVKDAGGNVLTGATASSFALAASGGSIGSASCTNGVCTATYTAPASPGSTSITAKIGGTNIVNSQVSMTITPVPTQYLVTRSTATPVAGAGVTISAQLADVNGSAVSGSGHVVTWSSTNGGSFGAATSTTDASGIATVTFTTSPLAGTVHTVTATESSLTGTSGNITTTAGSFAKLQLLVPGETAAPGTTTGKTGTPSAQTAASAFTITVNAVDANWNAVSSTDNIAITSSDGAATLPANAALVAGTKTYSVTLNTAGTATVTASDATDNSKSASTSPSITVNVGAPSATKTTLALGTATLPANGTTTITVTVKDAAGNIVTTATSSSFTLTTDAGSIGTVSCTNGVCTATFTAPGTAGTATITAKIGSNNVSGSTAAVTIAAAPGAPTGLSATSNQDSQVPLSWSAPASNGGSAITDYKVEYSSNGGASYSTFSHTASTSTSITVTGLTNGTSYTFRVSATNAIGTGSASPTATATPVGAPDAPTALAATPGSAQVSLSWTAPTNNGGSSITDYVIEYSSNGGTSWNTFSHTASTSTSITVTSLTNGTLYTFRVSATNANGTGAASSTVTATPGAPGAPTALTVALNQASSTSHTASLSWTAPASIGGSAISDYVIEYKASSASTWTTFSHTASTATTATITGFANSTTYDFRVAAKNSIGTGPYSSIASATTTGPSQRLQCQTNGNSNSNTTSATVTPCSGVHIGDIIVIPVAITNSGTAKTITSADGFTGLTAVQNNQDSQNQFQTTVFYKIATASDTGRTATYSFSWSGTEKSIITLVAYKNVDGSTPTMTSTTGLSPTLTAPSGPNMTSTSHTLLYFFLQNIAMSSTSPSISEWGLTTGTSSPSDLFKNTTAGANNANAIGVLTADIDKFTSGTTTTTEKAIVTGNSNNKAWTAIVLGIHP